MLKDIQQLKPSKILLIGERCKDIYCYGKCERISPEAPVPILKETKREYKAGMSANVANNLTSLGCTVVHLTTKEKLIKTRFIDERFNQQLLRLDEEEEIKKLTVEDIQKDLSSDLSFFKFDAVIFSDYNKGFLTYINIIKIIAYIREQYPNIPIFVDSKKNNLSCYENTILKINKKEFDEVTIFPNKFDCITTLGKNGAVWNEKFFDASETLVYDVCGAGDTFLSGLVTHYLSHFKMEEAIKFANICAGIAVKYVGTHQVSVKEIMEHLNNNEKI